MTARPATLLLFAAAVAVAARADEPRPPAGPWAAFPAGAWVVVADEEVGAAGRKTAREKRARVDLPGRPGLVAVFPEVDGKFPALPTAVEPRPPGVDVATDKAFRHDARRKGSQPINGEAVLCEVGVYRARNTGPDKRTTLTVTLWRAAGVDVPARDLAVEWAPIALGKDVVRAEAEWVGPAGSGTFTARVVATGEKIKVGDRELGCVREELTGSQKTAAGQSGATGTQWLSAAVPGHRVRAESAGTSEGKPFRTRTTVEDFFVPAAAQAPGK